jgi:hypothetical protein
MIKQIIGVLTFILGVFLYGRKTERNSIKNEENENAAKQIQAKNKIEQDVRNLSASERDRLRKIFSKPE